VQPVAARPDLRRMKTRLTRMSISKDSSPAVALADTPAALTDDQKTRVALFALQTLKKRIQACVFGILTTPRTPARILRVVLNEKYFLRVFLQGTGSDGARAAGI
jgi:hypothetical protein